MPGTPREGSGGARGAASAPSPHVFAQTQPDQWDAWYTAVTALSADINLLRTVGKALHRAKALDPGDWDDEPDAYQLSLLRRKLRTADILVADISTDPAKYKDKPEDYTLVLFNLAI